jgi:hypothetical protein
MSVVKARKIYDESGALGNCGVLAVEKDGRLARNMTRLTSNKPP